ncbi:MAG: c-type cytochrome [Sphingobacteriaceae bacterium]
MKKTFLILGICAVIAACGGNAEKQAEGDTTANAEMNADSAALVGATVDTVAVNHTATTPETKVAETVKEEKQEIAVKPVEKKVAKVEPKKDAGDGDIEAGKGLVAKSDCLACHRLDIKLVGPAYADVAKKYKPTAENIDHLADKIIKGGGGVWGEIPMSPHPGISKDDAKKMAKYVLSVR